MPQRRDVNRIRIFRINHYARDALRLAQSDISERLARVSGFINAVAKRRALAIIRFARAHPHDVRIGLANGYIADGCDAVCVENRFPCRTVVDGLPQTAGRIAYIKHIRIALDDGEVVNASAHAGRPNRTKPKAAQQRIIRQIDRRRRRSRRRYIWHGWRRSLSASLLRL